LHSARWYCRPVREREREREKGGESTDVNHATVANPQTEKIVHKDPSTVHLCTGLKMISMVTRIYRGARGRKVKQVRRVEKEIKHKNNPPTYHVHDCWYVIIHIVTKVALCLTVPT
jgi:hypothetical protein